MHPEISPDDNPKIDFLSPPRHSNTGPVIGILIILTLLIFGALFFWSKHTKEAETRNQIPYIPSGTTTIIIQETE